MKNSFNFFINLLNIFVAFVLCISILEPIKINRAEKVIEINKKCCAEIQITSDSEKTISPSKNQKPKMAIVIDDFGSYDQSGVETILKCGEKLTCAVIPNVDNTIKNIDDALIFNHEVILHMPMQAHVRLPESWYGPIYISSGDDKTTIYQKIDKCLSQFPEIKGFNIHIGSGISRNKTLMKYIYEYANEHKLYFLDSRTIITNGTTDACKETNSIYLGRDVFLEADKNKSYSGVCKRLFECANLALENGYSVAIGHVGAEGGENTARAVCDCIKKIKEMGVEIVPLYEIYSDISSSNYVSK